MFADAVLSGSFTTPASGNAIQTLQLPFIPDLFEIWIQGNASGSVWTGTGTPGSVKYAFWQAGMAPGSALASGNTAGAATDTSIFLATGGITPVISAANLYGPAVAGTAVSNASPPVMTTTPSNPFNSGDVVLLESTTGALQISGIPWSVTQLTATTYQLGDPAGGTAVPGSAATNVIAKKLLFPFVFTPYISDIVGMTLGATTTVVTAMPHGLSVGDSIRLLIPSVWGPSQISGQQGMILSVSDAWTFVVNINSSAATAFAFPSSAVAAAGLSFAQVVPFGDQASAFDLSATDRNFQGLMIGNSATAGAAILSANSALCLWRAQKSARIYTSLIF